VTTNYVVTELVALLTTRTRIPRNEVLDYVETIRQSPHIEVVQVAPALDAAALALLRSRPDKEWSLVDAVSFVVMTNEGMFEALTTDHHFLQAGFVRLPLHNM